MSTILHQTLSHHSLHPQNLRIIPHKKSWLLNLDVIVLSDSGNVYDAMFRAARAALWDAKVPRTRSVEYKPRKPGTIGNGTGERDMDVDVQEQSGFDTRPHTNKATDFELPDYWDEGEVLDGRDKWPVCVTLNLVCVLSLGAALQSILNELYSCHQYIIWMLLPKRKHPHRFDFF
jgi:exosome complex component RRP42